MSYEGHSINKLQNGVIFLIFKIWRIQNLRFVGNFILSTSCELYYSDFIIVTSLVLSTRSVCAVFWPPVFFHNLPSCEKNEQVQQANLFKCQMLLFHFSSSTYRPDLFKDLSHLSTSFWMSGAKNDAGCGHVVPPQQHFLDCYQISFTRHVLMVS